MLKINIFFKETMGGWDYEHTKHVHPENYDLVKYTVAKWDTLYSVLNFLWKENSIPKELTQKAISLSNSNIKPGDKISFEQQDNNSAELTINWKTEIINFKETNETKNTLWDIQKEILQALW